MDSFSPTFSFKTLSSELVTKIELMQKDGKVKTLATPTLLTANNEVSRIFDGKEYPIVTGWTVGETTSTQGVIENTEPTVEIERKEIALPAERFAEYISQQVLALEIAFTESPAGDNVVDSEIDEEPLKIAVSKL